MKLLETTQVIKVKTGLPGFFKIECKAKLEPLSVVLERNLVVETEWNRNTVVRDWLSIQDHIWGDKNYHSYEWTVSTSSLDEGTYYSTTDMDSIVKFFTEKMIITPEFVRRVLEGKAFAAHRELARQIDGTMISSWTESNEYFNTPHPITMEHLTNIFGDLSNYILIDSGCHFILTTLHGLSCDQIIHTELFDRSITYEDVKYIVKTCPPELILTPVLNNITSRFYEKIRGIAKNFGSEKVIIKMPMNGLDKAAIHMHGKTNSSELVTSIDCGLSTTKLDLVIPIRNTTSEDFKRFLGSFGVKGIASASKDALITKFVGLVESRIVPIDMPKKYIVISGRAYTHAICRNYYPKKIFGLKIPDVKESGDTQDFSYVLNSVILAVMIWKHMKGSVIYDPSYENSMYTTNNIIIGLIDGIIPVPSTLVEVV